MTSGGGSGQAGLRPRHRSLFDHRRLSPSALVPGLFALRGYRLGMLRGDLLAGLTVTAYLIPQVMAYAQVAGLPPAVGLFGIIGPALAYAVFGGSRRLSVGPESTTALMTAGAVAAVGASGGDQVALAAALALVVGVLCIAAWFFGLGFLADLLSRPVLVGYMAGVAVLMMVSQLGKVTGVPVVGETLPAQVMSAVRGLDHVHLPTVALSMTLLVGLLVAAKVAPRAPNALIAVLAATAAVAVFHLDHQGIATVGEIPRTLPAPQLPQLTVDSVVDMLGPAVGIAIVGYTDNILTGRAFQAADDPAIDANQEFLALGAANVGAGMLGGFAVSSSGSRTAIACLVGAKSQVYMLVTALMVVFSVAVLAPVLALFPRAALGAIVIYAATRLIEGSEIARIARFRRSEFVLLLTTTVGVFFLGVLGGIALAVALSLGDLVRRVARPHDGILGYVPGLGGMHDIDDYPEARQVPGLVVYRYDSPLFFANAEDFRERALAAVVNAPSPVHWLVLNAEANVENDLTSLDALKQLHDDLAARGVTLALTRVKYETSSELERHGVGRDIGSEHVFATLPEAVRAYLSWYREEFGRLPDGVRDLPDRSGPVRWMSPEE